METVVAALELHVSVVLPLGVMIVGLAANVTVGAVFDTVAFPDPHPPSTNRATKQVRPTESKRAVLMEHSPRH
jgi:hypothetical protein